jgi:hypothetical protein
MPCPSRLNISRRAVLTGMALAFGAAAIPVTVSQTAAQVKISQATARRPAPPICGETARECPRWKERRQAPTIDHTGALDQLLK